MKAKNQRYELPNDRPRLPYSLPNANPTVFFGNKRRFTSRVSNLARPNARIEASSCPSFSDIHMRRYVPTSARAISKNTTKTGAIRFSGAPRVNRAPEPRLFVLVAKVVAHGRSYVGRARAMVTLHGRGVTLFLAVVTCARE